MLYENVRFDLFEINTLKCDYRQKRFILSEMTVVPVLDQVTEKLQVLSQLELQYSRFSPRAFF